MRTLSPSRASDFKTCPLLYRFRAIDRLPERPTVEQARGTLVHAVLERLFDLPAMARTPESAAELVEPVWQRLRTERPELVGPLAGGPNAQPTADSEAVLLRTATELLSGYFAVEDPRRLEPAERECLIQVELNDDLLLKGYVDRLDVAPSGELRVVDYKTGGVPKEPFQGSALFQMKFYALVLWRARGVVPRMLRLLYLKNAEARDFSPDPDDLVRFERTLIAISQAIARATEREDFPANPGKLCGWCHHQPLCPAFGGTPPPFPQPRQLPSST
jgi:putative RecB family exonuclease